MAAARRTGNTTADRRRLFLSDNGLFQKYFSPQAGSMKLVSRHHPALTALHPSEPLWKRVPTRGDDGRPLSDFMMLIPGLREKPNGECALTVECIQQVLERYRHTVVFADLNLRLNVLWVSIRPVPGMVLELATAIKLAVPEALLVAQRGVYRSSGRARPRCTA